MKQIFEYK